MNTIINIPNLQGNATPYIANVLQALDKNANITISFAKGIYTFDKTGCSAKEIPVGYLSKSQKNIIFLLDKIENLTIDGNGSTFMFTDRLFPFALLNCRNITLKNFIIDFSFCRYCQGTVLNSDENSFELAIDRNAFQYSINAKGNVVFASGSDSFSTADLPILIGNTIIGKAPWDYIFAGEDDQDKSKLATSFIETDAEETDAGIRFNYRSNSRRLKLDINDLVFFNYEPRANINILMYECEKIAIQNVKMYRSGGMGIVGEFSKNILIDGLQVIVPATRNDFFSLTADSMFFTHCYGDVTVRNSRVEKTIDDALNIHGFYTEVAQVDGKKLILNEGLFSHKGTKIGYVGNLLQFYNRDTQNFVGEAIIEEINISDNESFELLMDRELFFVGEGDLVENDTLSANFLFENNHLYHCPQVRASDNGKLIIRNNIFEECIALLVDDLIDYWRETGCVNDLTISNNTFINTPWAGGDNGAINIFTTRIPTCEVRHKNIKITNNIFKNTANNPVQIKVEYADNVIIENNSFACGNMDKLITVKSCNDLKIENNQIKD
ncbi:MAG: hypothetical protein IJW31_07610 [Lentisphaeria bacterium]|nr:hypothetical protein [Lentisphaeria bacterium]